MLRRPLASTILVVFVGCGIDAVGTQSVTPIEQPVPEAGTPSLPPGGDAGGDGSPDADATIDPLPGFDPQHVDKRYIRFGDAVAVDVDAAPLGTAPAIRIVTGTTPTINDVASPALVYDATNQVVVWSVKSLHIKGDGNLSMWGRVRVTGTLPIVVVSEGDVTIEGVLSGYSDSTTSGPGGAAALAGQKGNAGAGIDGPSGGGGGGGGTAGAEGATVGTVRGGSEGSNVLPASKFVGGSAGGAGGSAQALCGAGGLGGGTVQISTMGAIAFGSYGGIDVGGGGGHGGCGGAGVTKSGGGGGGAGGFVQLEAIKGISMTTFTVIAAIGAGGGESGSVLGEGTAGDSAPFPPTTGVAFALGGSGHGYGNGGAGGYATAAPVAGSQGAAGGGGGGGAIGRVFLRTRGLVPSIMGTIVATRAPDDIGF